jgi:hypothetical protein
VVRIHIRSSSYFLSGIGSDWKTLGTILLDIHQVQIGEARLHEGLTSYNRRHEASHLSSATPFSSTEVTSLGKIATFIFKYRPMGKPFLIILLTASKVLNRETDILRYHAIVPSIGGVPADLHIIGNKRRACDFEDDTSDEDEQDHAQFVFYNSDSSPVRCFSFDFILTS